MATRSDHYHCGQCGKHVSDTDRVYAVNPSELWCQACTEAAGLALIQREAAWMQGQINEGKLGRFSHPEDAAKNADVEYQKTLGLYQPVGWGHDTPPQCASCTRLLIEPATTCQSRASKYCSQYCEWRSHKGGMKVPKPCGHCGESFTPKRSTAKFCSTKCRVYASRAQQTTAI